jgi:hypothetical protein
MGYKPGQKVPTSGIYRVNHDKNHAQSHEVTAVLGEPFPPCRNCGTGITYTLVREAHHVSVHPSLK